MDRPLCIGCKVNLAERSGSGRGFRRKCTRCRRTPEQFAQRTAAKKLKRRPWLPYKKDYCESPECSWQGRFAPFQLAVDHIDGDKTNNDPSNYKTLCHNCHAMKTYLNQENKRPGTRGKNVWVEALTAEATVC